MKSIDDVSKILGRAGASWALIGGHAVNVVRPSRAPKTTPVCGCYVDAQAREWGVESVIARVRALAA